MASSSVITTSPLPKSSSREEMEEHVLETEVNEIHVNIPSDKPNNTILIQQWDKKIKNNIDYRLDLDKQPNILDFQKKSGMETRMPQCGKITKEDPNIKNCGYRVTIYTRFKDVEQWIYCLTINNKIMKFGLTIKTLNERFDSYSAGTKTNRESGTCSTTNYSISNLICSALESNHIIDLYGFPCPRKFDMCEACGETIKSRADHTKTYESIFINKFKELYGILPIMGGNHNKKTKTISKIWPSMTKKKLKIVCRELKIGSYSHLNRTPLIDLLKIKGVTEEQANDMVDAIETIQTS